MRAQPYIRGSGCRVEYRYAGHMCQRSVCKNDGGKNNGCPIKSELHNVDVRFSEWVPAVNGTATDTSTPGAAGADETVPDNTVIQKHNRLPKAAQPGCIAVNAQSKRLDVPMKLPTEKRSSKYEAVTTYRGSRRIPCPSFFLHGACRRPGQCKLDRNPKCADEDVLKALRCAKRSGVAVF